MPERAPPIAAPGAVNIVVLNDGDNVGIATRDVKAGESARDIMGRGVTAAETIPLGHKVALRAIAAEGIVVRCGVPVAVATQPIAEGALVHVHNVASRYMTNDEDHYE